MKKKTCVLLFVAITMFVLVGWGKKEVRLLDSSKLIDLNAAIGLAKPGGTAGDTEESSKSSESDIVEKDEKSDGENHAAHDNIDVIAKDIVIRIRGEQISYTCGSFNRSNISDLQLETRIRQDYMPGAHVTLMDDFAEAHVYKSVCDILDELNRDMGLTYKEDRVVGGE